MPNNDETGHSVNVANCYLAISAIEDMGDAYNPSSSILSIPELVKASELVRKSVSNLYDIDVIRKQNINNRQIGFKSMKANILKVWNLVRSYDLDDDTLADIRHNVYKVLARKLKSGTKNHELTQSSEPETEKKKTKSTIQSSYALTLDYISKLIIQLKSLPEYNPNEPHLKIETLEQQHQYLEELCKYAVINNDKYTASIHLRNELLYANKTGLVNRMFAIKLYLKSVHGIKSDNYLIINRFKFRRFKL